MKKRRDGYHDIHTVFQELDFHDRISLKKKEMVDVLLNQMSTGLVTTTQTYVLELSNFSLKNMISVV